MNLVNTSLLYGSVVGSITCVESAFLKFFIFGFIETPSPATRVNIIKYVRLGIESFIKIVGVEPTSTRLRVALTS